MYMTAFARVTQNNAVLLENNDSRDYKHQTNMRVEIAAGATYTVPVTNLNAGEVLLAVKSDNANTPFTLALTDTVSGMNGAVEVNRFFMASLKGLTGLTITNDSGAADTFTIVMGDE